MDTEPASSRRARLALPIALAAGAAAVAFALYALPARGAGAAGIMSAPDCQCSAPTLIASLSVNAVHCICGAMSCVLSRDAGPFKGATPPHLMQCR